MTKKIPVFVDLAAIAEDNRIQMIGHQAVDHKKVVGFLVEDDSKADRYLEKLKEKYPTVTVISRTPISGSILVKVGPPAEAEA